MLVNDLVNARSFSFLFLFLSIFSILRTNIYSYTQIWHLHVSWRPVEWILRCNFRSLKSHYTTRTCPVPTLQWIFLEKNFLLLIREFYLRKAEGYLKIIMISGSMPPQDVWFAFRIGGGIVVECRYHTLWNHLIQHYLLNIKKPKWEKLMLQLTKKSINQK